MRNSYLLFITSLLIIIGINSNSLAQDIKKEEETKRAAKVQQAASVSVFQIKFAQLNDRLQHVLTKNETILHFKQEANTSIFVMYLPEGNSKTDLIDFFKSNEIEQFEIMRFQQGVRKVNLFNKRF